MSTDVYSRVLWWNGERGIVKDVEFTIQLRAPPSALPQVAEIDFGEVEFDTLAYRPEIRLTKGSQRREMEEAEIVMVKAWLVELRREVLLTLKAQHEHFAIEKEEVLK